MKSFGRTGLQLERAGYLCPREQIDERVTSVH